MLHRVYRIEKIGLTCPRCRASHIDSGNRWSIEDDDGAAGRSASISEVPDANTAYIRNAAVSFFQTPSCVFWNLDRASQAYRPACKDCSSAHEAAPSDSRRTFSVIHMPLPIIDV